MNPIYFENGIYYIDPTHENPPKILYIENKKLSLLLGFIYIPTQTNNLTKAQIISINKLRYINKSNKEVYYLNSKIKFFFADIIKYLQTDSLLDFGCGYDPIINYLDTKVNFVGFDIDMTVIPLLGDNIKITSNLTNLKKYDFDLVISIFVFHFDIKIADIRALYNILKDNGMIIANVYNRTSYSKNILHSILIKEGFIVQKLSLFSKKNHELWIIAKMNLNDKVIHDITKISKTYW